MSDTPLTTTLPRLGDFGNVAPEGYLYYEKRVTTSDALSLPSAYLKWYNLYPDDAPVTDVQEAECRAFVTAEVERLQLKQELGFVILHRAGSVLLLLLTTWRNTNEMWEAVYFTEVDQPAAYAPVPAEDGYRGTYCVWELGIVWNERNAWMRFLSSTRDEAAKRAYVQERFAGMV